MFRIIEGESGKDVGAGASRQTDDAAEPEVVDDALHLLAQFIHRWKSEAEKQGEIKMEVVDNALHLLAQFIHCWKSKAEKQDEVSSKGGSS